MRSTTPRTPPIERHFSRLGCSRARPREAAEDRHRTGEEGGSWRRRVDGSVNRHTGFDDTSTEGRTPTKTQTTTYFFEHQMEWFNGYTFLLLSIYIHRILSLQNNETKSKSKVVPSHFSSIYKQSFFRLTEFSHASSFGVGQGPVWHRHVV